jgi:predicted dehydrogenase
VTAATGGIVRIGCLGAAKIAPNALVKPARNVDGVEVTAIAARDRRRAHEFADKHGIPNVHATYDDVVEDPDIDAVYIPLPNGLHAEWMRKALEHGKHVLCEKPFTSNAAQAESIRDLAAQQHPDLVVMEAFHMRYHPLAQRMVDIVQGGELGEVRHLDASFCFPLFARHDIRWQLDLAGGALMDAGCYAIHMVRHMAGADGDEPTVTHAEAKLRSPGVDRWIRADLRWPDGRTGRVTASMWSANVLRLAAHATGDRGTMRVLNPLAPHLFNRLGVTGRRPERVKGESTYTHQLRAFADAVTNGTPTATRTPPADSVANMRVIDAVYRAAGLRPRGDLDKNTF